MRANEFIKRFGWEKARLAVKGLLPMHEGYPVFDYNSDDLKRYVDAYELVDSLVSIYGNLEVVKEKANYCGCSECRCRIRAITLVEECQ